MANWIDEALSLALFLVAFWLLCMRLAMPDLAPLDLGI